VHLGPGQQSTENVLRYPYDAIHSYQRTQYRLLLVLWKGLLPYADGERAA
jgi:hypothetical protein